MTTVAKQQNQQQQYNDVRKTRINQLFTRCTARVLDCW